jgi:hypothetical protein
MPHTPKRPPKAGEGVHWDTPKTWEGVPRI